MSLLRRAAAAPIEVYRPVVSPREFGILRGLVLAAWRLLRCNPWSHGGFDPVVEQRVFPLRRHFGAHRTTKHAGS